MLFYSEMKEVRMLRKRAILAGSGELKAKDRFFGASVEDGQQVHFSLFYFIFSYLVSFLTCLPVGKYQIIQIEQSEAKTNIS